MVVPVRWWCRSWLVSSGRSARAAPPATRVRPVVPEGSANMTVFWLSGRGMRHGDVSCYAWTRGPPAVVAQGVVKAGVIRGTA